MEAQNIYQKLMTARLKLQTMKLNKSGQNKFAGYSYFELGDFLPTINRLFAELGICSVIKFNGTAELSLFNMDNTSETIVFTSPMATAALKGCHDVQNLGAVQTYLRRYLYINALEIVEHDALDATAGKEEEKKKQTPINKTEPKEKASDNNGKKATEAQLRLIHSRIKNCEVEEETVKHQFEIEHWNDLPFAKVNDVLEFIDSNKS